WAGGVTAPDPALWSAIKTHCLLLARVKLEVATRAVAGQDPPKVSPKFRRHFPRPKKPRIPRKPRRGKVPLGALIAREGRQTSSPSVRAPAYRVLRRPPR